jgi:hypothetical protein
VKCMPGGDTSAEPYQIPNDLGVPTSNLMSAGELQNGALETA